MEPSNILLADPLNDPNRPSILCIYHDANGNGNEDYEKAIEVQDSYQNDKAIDVIVIVLVGNKISIRYPNSDQWEEHSCCCCCDPPEAAEATTNNNYNRDDRTKATTTMNNILQSIDDDDEWGLEIPIFLFSGKQSYGVTSFRSKKRVPTHLVLTPGRGYSMEDYLQSLLTTVGPPPSTTTTTTTTTTGRSSLE